MTFDLSEVRENVHIKNYTGKTFVAVLDVSGFKEMMKIRDRAESALGKFYSTIYIVGRNFLNTCSHEDFLEVNAIVVSDCAVIFSRNVNPANQHAQIQDKTKGLRSILAFIQRINQRLIDSGPESGEPIMTTCSIAYGNFKYEDRIELYEVSKNYFLGHGYVNAFLDNESKTPRIQPGQCRLLKQDLDLPDNFPINAPRPLSLLEPTDEYYYFHWMLPNLESLRQFKKDYEDTYQLKYAGMIKVLQKYSSRTRNR